MADEHRAAAPHVDYVGREEITVARLDDIASDHVPAYSRMLVDEAISFANDRDFRIVAFAQGFTNPSGAMLQADGIFFRNVES